MFKNKDNSISQGIEGDNNQQALNDIYNIHLSARVRKVPSNIANLLQGISDMVDSVTPTELDVVAFDLLKKVKHNEIVVYRQHFDFYVENINLIEAKLKILVEYDALCREKIIKYVRIKWATIEASSLPDVRISTLVQLIKNDLLGHSTLNLEDIEHVPHVVFYVFSECKIFDKPPC